ALDDDGATAHARRAAAVGGADLPAGVAADADEAAGHLAADPVRRVALHLDRAAPHVGTEVHPGVAEDRDPAAGHAAADPLHPPDVAADLDILTALPFHREHVIEPEPPLAEEHRQRPDRVVREP